MEEALYGTDGYYRRRDWPVGADGDFVTAPAMSPLFAACTARLVRRVAERLGLSEDMLEVGFGDGRHLRELAARLGGARLRGLDRNGRTAPPGVETIASLDDIALANVRGVIFSYELFDALPARRLVGTAEGPREMRVDLDANSRFVYRQALLEEASLSSSLRAVANRLAPGQVADVAEGWEPLYRELTRRLGEGLIVTCDYGFADGRLYDMRARPNGTLAAYRRHRVHRDLLVDVGEQDLSEHVDFDLLREVGESEGLATVALTRLANWLVACGLFGDLAEAAPQARAEAMALLDLEGPGTETLVLVQSRGIDGAAATALFDVPLLAAR